MDELGAILREAREMKGLTLAEAQEETRINARYLEALEAGEYALLPSPVHTRGFLRNYARFLGLDAEPLLERYEVQRGRRRAADEDDKYNMVPDARVAPGPGQPFFEPVNMDLDGSSGSDSTVRIVVIIALLVAIGLAASRFVPLLLGRGDGQDNLPQMIEGILADETETAEAATPASNEPLITSEPINPTGRNNPDAPTRPPASPSPPPLPATMESVILRLDITERTWVRVTIDGEVVLEDQVTREDGPFEWEAEEEAQLLTGNAAGVVITINDVEIGRLGGRGEIAEQRWATTGN